MAETSADGTVAMMADVLVALMERRTVDELAVPMAAWTVVRRVAVRA